MSFCDRFSHYLINIKSLIRPFHIFDENRFIAVFDENMILSNVITFYKRVSFDESFNTFKDAFMEHFCV